MKKETTNFRCYRGSTSCCVLDFNYFPSKSNMAEHSRLLNNQASQGWSSSFVSDTYEKTRPDYNTDSVEFLLENVGALEKHLEQQEPFTVVELGAGTGKFTRAVLTVLEKRSVKNVKIIATEPIKEMCEKFKDMVPSIEIKQRPAHDLGKFKRINGQCCENENVKNRHN